MPHASHDSLSTHMVRATDQLLQRAIGALEAAGADMEQRGHEHRILLMPGDHLHAVGVALEAWRQHSCQEDACSSWADPRAQAAQEAFRAVETVFDFPDDIFKAQANARVPVGVSGDGLGQLQHAQGTWERMAHPHPRRRLG